MTEPEILGTVHKHQFTLWGLFLSCIFFGNTWQNVSLKKMHSKNVAQKCDVFAFLEASIVPAMTLIGCTDFCISLAGVVVGNFFGSRYKKGAEVVGDVILILLGAKILLEHLGILG